MDYLILIALGFAVMALFGIYVSVQKRRNPFEGLVLGLLFGPLGVLIAAVLPAGETGATRPAGAAKGRHRPSLAQNLFGPPPHRRKD